MSDSKPPDADKHASLNNRIQAAALLLNSIGLVVVGATFVANCQEAESTRESTQLLAESNAMRDRPWVVLSSFKGDALACNTSIPLHWTMQNGGPVPALVVVSKVRTFTADINPSWSQILERPALTSLGYVAPSGEIRLGQLFDLPCDEYEDIERGKRRVFACLNVEYTGPNMKNYSFAACNLYVPSEAAWTLFAFTHELVGESSFAPRNVDKPLSSKAR